MATETVRPDRGTSDLTVGRVGVPIARTQPEKVALDDGRRQVTYGQLDNRADRLASALAGLGVKKGDVVAAYLPNCIEYVLVVLAVARAGAVFLPLNPRFKAYEIGALLRIGSPLVVFTTRERQGTIAEAANHTGGQMATMVVVDSGDDPQWEGLGLDQLLKNPVRPLPAVEEADFFSLMFTSGTTGEPKGALGTHRARMLWVLNAAIQYGLSQSDVYLGTMPQVHSAGLTFTLMHLYVGARVRIMEHFDAAGFLEIADREQVTSSLTVPTMLTMILEAIEGGSRAHSLGSLKRVVTCGSPLPLVTKRRVLEKISDQLYDYYGSTESNSMSVLKPCDQLRKPNSVGLPFTNVELMIAGRRGASVPPGEMGEIWCRNPSVMTRYKDLPEETAAAFSGGWYHTGDLGYLDEEGYLYIVGRLKDMILSGGVNIYPAEIEHVLLMHPDILDCAVVGVLDARWGQAVKAYVQLRGSRRPDLAELQEHCMRYLADYKKPRHLEIVTEIPKNAGGKTVKAALPGNGASSSAAA